MPAVHFLVSSSQAAASQFAPLDHCRCIAYPTCCPFLQVRSLALIASNSNGSFVDSSPSFPALILMIHYLARSPYLEFFYPCPAIVWSVHCFYVQYSLCFHLRLSIFDRNSSRSAVSFWLLLLGLYSLNLWFLTRKLTYSKLECHLAFWFIIRDPKLL